MSNAAVDGAHESTTERLLSLLDSLYGVQDPDASDVSVCSEDPGLSDDDYSTPSISTSVDARTPSNDIRPSSPPLQLLSSCSTSSTPGSFAIKLPPDSPSPSFSIPASPFVKQEMDLVDPSLYESVGASETYRSVIDLRTQAHGCQCKKKVQKMNRHWASCPFNPDPNRPTVQCPYCDGKNPKLFKGGSARANMIKHVKVYHRGKPIPPHPRRK